jgi:hypothetical protein
MSASETIERVVHGDADVQIGQPRRRLSGLRSGGGAIAVIADQVEDGSGGALGARFEISRDEGGILVGDEPREFADDGSSPPR